MPAQSITPKAAEKMVPSIEHENCELFGGLGATHVVQSIVIVSLLAAIVILYRGWLSKTTRIPHNIPAIATSKTLIVS